MKHEIKITEYFYKQTKRLEKKYPYITKDIFAALTIVDDNPEAGQKKRIFQHLKYWKY